MINALRPFHLLDTKNMIFIFMSQNSQKLKLNKNVRNLTKKSNEVLQLVFLFTGPCYLSVKQFRLVQTKTRNYVIPKKQ